MEGGLEMMKDLDSSVEWLAGQKASARVLPSAFQWARLMVSAKVTQKARVWGQRLAQPSACAMAFWMVLVTAEVLAYPSVRVVA